MIILATLPIVFSSLLIAAHFYRSGSMLLTAISLVFPLLLLIRNQWVPRVLSLFLLLAAAEWLQTMLLFVERYQQAGMPATRMAIILSCVSLFTALTTLVFLTRGMKKRFRVAGKL